MNVAIMQNIYYIFFFMLNSNARNLIIANNITKYNLTHSKKYLSKYHYRKKRKKTNVILHSAANQNNIERNAFLKWLSHCKIRSRDIHWRWFGQSRRTSPRRREEANVRCKWRLLAFAAAVFFSTKLVFRRPCSLFVYGQL